MTPDQINGSFEFVGGFCTWANFFSYLKVRMVAGVFWPSTLFYSAWGIWNCFYYPQINQPWSFWGGIFIVLGNIAWILLVMKDKVKKINN